MELYLIRHGIAQERGVEVEDTARALTSQGRAKTKKVAQRLQKLNLQFDLVLTSPLVRAQQTAEILLESGLTSQVVAISHLAPAGSLERWLDWLKHWQKQPKTVALVGHQPDLGNWASILVWGEVRDVIVLKKAGIIGLSLPETDSPIGHSQLFWLTPPKLLL